MSAEAAQVFVYYRVRAADAAVAIAALRALQASLPARLPGLACSLSRRADAASDPVTLMETYSHAEGLSATARGAIEAHMQPGSARWIVGERHVEVFVPCA